jgi:hypothetical protein
MPKAIQIFSKGGIPNSSAWGFFFKVLRYRGYELKGKT